MNILVLTSAMRDEDFTIFQNSSKVKVNASNQNFYSKLIKTLALHNNVSVICHRPFIKGMFTTNILEKDTIIDKNTRFYYTYERDDKAYKFLDEQREIISSAVEAIEDWKLQDFIIVVDTLRFNLVKAAISLKRRYGCRVVGMLTDNPLNLSNGNSLFHQLLINQASRLDAYLSLTSGLVDVYNQNKPSYVFEGLVQEENEEKRDPITNYFFFGGSLYEKYGVKTLVDAFHESNLKSKLVIAGSGPLEKYIESLAEDDYRILYLSQISKEKAISYMKNAIANINPRPLNSKLDAESVPSKLIEYLSIGVPVISTKYPKLYGTFKDDVNWIQGNEVFEMKAALENYDVTIQEQYIKKAMTAKRKVFEFYGLDVQAESIDYFLASISSSNN